jgi:predicted O-linked N-acetylglucosamine transferase (SPINDLY family)
MTFGCLNNFSKVNESTLDLWAQVMNALPKSRLLLRTPPGSARERVLGILCRHQIDSARVEFVDRQPRDEYLATHRRIDVCLDTFPYNGHTTMLDALWMGVPTVSLAGDTTVSRGGLSILSNIGLAELVAKSREEYVRLAVELTQDRGRLAQLRSGLPDRMKNSPLMDARRFARSIEAAFRQMWLHWCASPEENGKS